MHDVDIVVVIHNNLSYLNAINLYNSAESLKSNLYSISWNCVLTYGTKDDMPKVYTPFKVLSRIKKDYEHCSQQHGEAINIGIANSTANYILISDPDVIVLYKDWDKILINNIYDKNIAIGTEYPTVGHFRGDGHFRNFPSLVFCMFDSSVRNLEFDCRPKLKYDPKKMRVRQSIESIDDENLARIYNIEKGSLMGMDTGYKLPILFNLNGYFSKVIKYHDILNGGKLVTSKKDKKWCKKEISENIFFEEYHMDNDLFVSHLGRGSSKTNESRNKLKKIWLKNAASFIKDKTNIEVKFSD